jgi:hypothetical protein
MMLVELLKHAQFITFNKIRKYKYTELFNNIILEKKSTYRKKGLELIDECVKEISKRDRSEQSNMLSKIYSDIFKEKQQNDVDSEVNCGVMMVLKSLLTYANKEIFEENFLEICEFVNELKVSKTINNQQMVLEMYPILSSYSHETFQNSGFLTKAVENLLRLLRSQNHTLKKAGQNALAKILEPYHADNIKDLSKLILTELYSIFNSGDHKGDTSILPCMVSISIKVQKYFSTFFTTDQIHELIDMLLSNGISEDIITYLEFLLKIGNQELNFIIQIKLLYTISYVLTGELYPFIIHGEVKESTLHYINLFKSMLNGEDNPSRMNLKEVNNEALICVALSCLSRFKFPDFSDQLVWRCLIPRVCLSTIQLLVTSTILNLQSEKLLPKLCLCSVFSLIFLMAMD